MPHQCVRCSTFYDDGAKEILEGCSCGARLFFYVKKSKMKKAEEQVSHLSDDDKRQIEKDVLDIVEGQKDEGPSDGDDPHAPVVLDLESIKVLKPGQFEVDLVNLFNKDQPLVYKLEEGKYVVDIPSTLQMKRDGK